jgi:NAD(P)-dependent dehydrogenase (short-subunit alcohol dehydrogenase family)
MYSASKFALEGYAEALRHEVKPFNIQVSLIEAGFLNTPLRTKRQSANQQIAAYDVWRKRAFDRILGNEEQGPPSRLVADTTLHIIEAKAPQLRYIIGKEARLTTRLRRWMPQSVFEQGTRRSFSLDKET